MKYNLQKYIKNYLTKKKNYNLKIKFTKVYFAGYENKNNKENKKNKFEIIENW